MMSRNSTIEPGQPCVTISGSASGSGERTWSECTRAPSISVRKWSNTLSRASARRQSYSSRQYATSSARYAELGAVVPAGIGDLLGETAPAPAARAGRRARVSGMSMRNGSMVRSVISRNLSLATRAPDWCAYPALPTCGERSRSWSELTRSPRSSGRRPRASTKRSATASIAPRRRCATSTGSRSPTFVARWEDGEVKWYQVTMKVGFRLDDDA